MSDNEPLRHSIFFWLYLCVGLGILSFYLWTEHRAHTLGALPYVLLLACPLLHVLMHRGHGGHRGEK